MRKTPYLTIITLLISTLALADQTKPIGNCKGLQNFINDSSRQQQPMSTQRCPSFVSANNQCSGTDRDELKKSLPTLEVSAKIWTNYCTMTGHIPSVRH